MTETKLQIGCYLTEDETKELRAYAQAHELRVPSLCALIVLHELRCRRLSDLKSTYLRKVGKQEGQRVTARFSRPELKEEFSNHVNECGIGSDDATGVLIRAELQERWLDKALQWTGNRP
jgi:hypothetical protein